GPGDLLVDVDGDGDLDAVLARGAGPSFPLDTRPSLIEVALNDGTGAFGEAFSYPAVGVAELAGVADVDKDGDLDIVAGRCVYFAAGPIRPPQRLPGPVIPTFDGPRDVGDIDGDGDIDVGIGLGSLFDNDGKGNFSPGAALVQPPPYGIEYAGPGYPGDFDGDGDIDLLVELRG